MSLPIPLAPWTSVSCAHQSESASAPATPAGRRHPHPSLVCLTRGHSDRECCRGAAGSVCLGFGNSRSLSPLLFPPPPTGLGTPAFFPEQGVGGEGTRKSQPSGANSETANSRQSVRCTGMRVSGTPYITRLSCDTPPESFPRSLLDIHLARVQKSGGYPNSFRKPLTSEIPPFRFA